MIGHWICAEDFVGAWQVAANIRAAVRAVSGVVGRRVSAALVRRRAAEYRKQGVPLKHHS